MSNNKYRRNINVRKRYNRNINDKNKNDRKRNNNDNKIIKIKPFYLEFIKHNYKIGYNQDEKYIFIKFKNLNFKNIISKLESNIMHKTFMIWLKEEENYELLKTKSLEYDYSINDDRINNLKYDIIIEKGKNDLLILMKDEYIPCFSFLVAIYNVKNIIIPEIKNILNNFK